MTVLELLALLAIAGVCGALGQALAGARRGGCLVAVVLGFIGALLGPRLAAALDLPEVLTLTIDGQPFPVVWATVGAALFVAVLSLLTPRRS